MPPSTHAITFIDNSPESCDHFRRAIDDEINSLQESIRVLKSRRNTAALISRLPPETLATIFAFLSGSAWNEGSVHLEWIRVTHVCRLWREVALDHPRLWSCINVRGTKPIQAGLAEILARAKMAPLHLDADYTNSKRGYTYVEDTHFKVFERQLEAHISHTRHLKFIGYIAQIWSVVMLRLVSPTPALESLSLFSESPRVTPISIPDNFLNCTAPKLTTLELKYCDISWKSPLFKGLRTLQILGISTEARPKLEDWLDALNEMPNLKTLSLQHATPLARLASPLISEPSRTITLPFLTHFNIHALAKDCALALAHLLLPALTWLHVDIKSVDEGGEDVRLVTPYIARNVYVLQDIEPIRSILIAGEETCAEVYAWAMPDADVKVCGPETLGDMSRSACLQFSAKGKKWRHGVDHAIFDALLTLLPVNSVLTFTAQKSTRLSKRFWLRHAPRWSLLEQARLVSTSIGVFAEMLAKDIPPDGPRLPSLTKLILLDVQLCVLRTYHLRNMLIKRVEQGVPLEVLDLRTCVAANHAIQLLAEIVTDVQGPLDVPPPWIAMQEFFKDVGIGECDQFEYGYGRRPWYVSSDMSGSEGEDEDEDEDEDEAEHDDEFV